MITVIMLSAACKQAGLKSCVFQFGLPDTLALLNSHFKTLQETLFGVVCCASQCMILVHKQAVGGVWMKCSLDFIRKKCISHIFGIAPGSATRTLSILDRNHAHLTVC